MAKKQYNKSRVFLKLTASVLAFLFVFTPIVRVAADTTTVTVYPSKYYNITVGGSGSPTDSTTITKHIFGNGNEIGTVTGTGADAVPRYVHTDQLTGSNVVTNAAASKDETLDYFPFGSVRIDSGTYSDQRKYIGQEYDTDTGLNYLNARYYDSNAGKFISEDPQFWNFDKSWLVDPQNQNSYSYARNNPTTLSDPSGKAIGIDDIIMLGLAYLFEPSQLQADPTYEPQQYIHTSGYHPQIFFGGDAVEVGGGGLAPENLMGVQKSPVSNGFDIVAEAIPETKGSLITEGTFYRSASGTSDSLTPRPGIDTVGPKAGLSGWDSIKKVSGNKVVEVDISKLSSDLQAIKNSDGHISIIPKTQNELNSWAATRNTGQISPLTKAIQSALFKK